MDFLAGIHARLMGTIGVPAKSTFVPLSLSVLAVMLVIPPRTEAMPARDEDPDLGDPARRPAKRWDGAPGPSASSVS